MQMIIEVFLALALFSITGVLINAAGRAKFSPLPKTDGAETYIVIAVSGGAAGLEQTVAGIKSLSRAVKMDCKTVILDNGLDERGRLTAALTVRGDESVTLCGLNELQNELTQLHVK